MIRTLLSCIPQTTIINTMVTIQSTQKNPNNNSCECTEHLLSRQLVHPCIMSTNDAPHERKAYFSRNFWYSKMKSPGFATFLYFFVCMYINCVSQGYAEQRANVFNKRQPQQKRLPDLGFDILP